MIYFIEITDGLITCKGEGDFRTDTQIEVTEDIYKALTSLPATYTEEKSNIVCVRPLHIQSIVPEQELTLEEYLVDLDFRFSMQELGL